MTVSQHKEEDRKKIFLVFGGSLFLGLVLGVFAYFEYGKVQSVRGEVESMKGQITAAEKKQATIPDLERDVIVLRENVLEYVKILPDGREVNDFVTKINQFADMSGVVVTTLDDVVRRNNRKKQKDPFERVAFEINLEGNTNQVMAFMSHFETYERFVMIPTFKIKPGKSTEGAKPVRHEVEMTLETFVYNAGGSGLKRVEIANYDSKREKYQVEIIEARTDISVEKYVFAVNEHRRDPFMDPRISHTDAQAMTLAREKQLLDEFKLVVSDITKLMAQETAEKDLIAKSELRHQTDEKIRGLLKEIDEAKSQGLFTIAAVFEELENDVEETLRLIVEARGLNPNRQLLTAQDLMEIRDQMRDLFDEGNYEDVIRQFEDLARDVDPTEQSVEFLMTLEEISTMKEHALAILDFQDREVLINGVLFRPGSSTVIINGMVLVEGDFVDDEVRVGSIHEDEIEFNFRKIRISKLVQQ